jgi:hypothetical protein
MQCDAMSYVRADGRRDSDSGRADCRTGEETRDGAGWRVAGCWLLLEAMLMDIRLDSTLRLDPRKREEEECHPTTKEGEEEEKGEEEGRGGEARREVGGGGGKEEEEADVMVRGPGPRLDEEGEDPAGKARPIATALPYRLPRWRAPRPVLGSLGSEQRTGARAFGGGAGRTAEMGGPRGPRRGSSVCAQGTWGPRRPLPVHAPSSQVTPPLRFAARVLVPPPRTFPPLGRRLSSRPVVFLILPPSREKRCMRVALSSVRPAFPIDNPLCTTD